MLNVRGGGGGEGVRNKDAELHGGGVGVGGEVR